jgi:glycosyltransferase involved in cell wall biosynthesis
VILEALASGTPVAAFPVPGPRDILENSRVGVLGENLAHSAMQALHVCRENCRKFALTHSWERSLDQFEGALQPVQPNSDFPFCEGPSIVGDLCSWPSPLRS